MKRCTALNALQRASVFFLWNSEYPARLNYASQDELENYLTSLKDQHHILLVGEGDKVLGWYFDFIREEERWFAMILDAAIQGKGYGGELLDLAKQENKVLNGWVIDHENDLKANGEPYGSPLQFYINSEFR